MTSLPPLSLYVHFPWCVRKCPYCDFNSYTLHNPLPQEPYIDALLEDLRQQAEAVQDRPLQSLFMGGGTPSLFGPQAIARLLEGIRAQCRLVPEIEVTLEANPGTIERARFADYRAAGITRVSLGAQSFDDRQLQRLGRIHAVLDTHRAVEELHAAGLTNFNLDLMYGLPGQTLAESLADLATAIASRPAHISHYQLTLEPGTVFAGRPPEGLPDPDAVADMQGACQAQLALAGFMQYEVSAYALEGRRCRHNLNYWQFGDYLGIGAGAHGKNSRISGAAMIVERSVRSREPRRYLAEIQNGDFDRPKQPVWASELTFEYFLNALRLTDGFAAANFESRTDLPFAVALPALETGRRRGLLSQAGDGWRPTALGLNFLNDLQMLFLAVSDDGKSVCRTRPAPTEGGRADEWLYTQRPTPATTN